MFAFDPPPDFDPADDPAVTAFEEALAERVLAEERAVRVLLERCTSPGAMLFTLDPDELREVEDALRLLWPAYEPGSASVAWAYPITTLGADRLAERLGGTWDGPVLRSPRCPGLRAVLAGSSVDPELGCCVVLYLRSGD